MKHLVSPAGNLLLLTFLFTIISNAFAADQLTDFHIFASKDIVGESSEIEGNLAAGRKIILEHYDAAFTAKALDYAIVSGGKLKFTQGTVGQGQLVVKAETASIEDVAMPNSSLATNINELPIDFLVEKTRLKRLSKQYSKLPITGEVKRSFWQMEFKGDCQSARQVFQVEARELAKAFRVTTDCIPSDAEVIINLSGEKPHFAYKSLFAFDAFADKTLFNFYEAKSLAMFAVVWPGSILAPRAKTKTSFSALKGQLVTKKWEHNYVIADFVLFNEGAAPEPNQLPVITSEAPTSAQATVLFSYNIVASDPDGDQLSYSLSEAPDGMALTDNSLTWTPAQDQVGIQSFEILVSDGADQVIQAVSLDVSPAPNTPPVINSEPVTEGQENVQYQYTIEAVDTDIPAQTLVYHLVDGPEGMALSGNRLEWIPNFEQAGEYDVTITVSDGLVVIEQAFILTIANTNRLPEITSVPSVVLAENTAYLYQVTTLDPDGDHVALALKSNPDGMSINPDNQVVWLPGFLDAGTYDISLEASDGHDAVQQDFTLTVVDVNAPPQFTSMPVESVAENEPYLYDVAASDIDGQPLNFILVGGPSGMALSNNRLQWLPSFDQAGSHAISLSVTDGQLTATQNFVVDVANVNRKPKITSSSPISVQALLTYSYSIEAEDPDTDSLSFSLEGEPEGMELTGNQVNWIPSIEDEGEHTFTVNVSDGVAEDTQSITLIVTPGDSDGDGVIDPEDAFPNDASETQDTDQDGIGNNADADDDNDNWTDAIESECLTDPLDNLSIPDDADQDGQCDLIDTDDDNDGVIDTEDAFPFDSDEAVDTDEDGIGNNADKDDDNDNWLDADEAQCETDALNSNSVPVDTDLDGQCDLVDEDDDNDLWLDGDELACQTDPKDSASVPEDYDEDKRCNLVDTDDDNDLVEDALDAFPLDETESVDTDADGIGNNADTDDDNDGVLDSDDAFPLDEEESLDTDTDGIGNNADTDDDNDGWSDISEMTCQTDSLDVMSIPADFDMDGACDLADTDDDNDGWLDEDEISCLTNPLQAESQPIDSDGDALCDVKDLDDDNDGVLDAEDAFPLNPEESRDTDGDGIGNIEDEDDDNDGFSDSDELAANTDPLDAANYPDVIAPVINLVTQSQTTIDSSFIVQVSVTDDSAVDAVKVVNDQVPDMVLVAEKTAENYTVTIPLALGVNLISFTAIDTSGNQATAQLTLTREHRRIHTGLSLTSPQNGQQTNEPLLTIAGSVTSEQPAKDIKVTVNGLSAELETTQDVRVFNFKLKDLPLSEGQNLIRIEAFFDFEQYADETLSETRIVTFTPEIEQQDPPVVSFVQPTPGTFVNQQSFYVTVSYQSEVGVSELMINDSPVSVLSPYAGTVSELVTFPEHVSQWQVNARVTDTLGQASEANARYQIDSQAPELSIDGGYLPSPVENPVNTQPLSLSGQVSDTNLASFTINGEPVGLEPLSEEGAYRFATQISLSNNLPTQVDISAMDFSGNATQLDYTFVYNSELALSMLLPPAETRLIDQGDALTIQVAARIQGEQPEGLTAEGSIVQDNQVVATQPLALSEGLVSGTLSNQLDAGDYAVRIQLKANGLIISQAQQAFVVEDKVNLPLALTRLEPANGDEHIETNSGISLYFNQPIELAKLQLLVKETAHGFSYINNDPPGVDGFNAKGYELVRVDIDDAEVKGGLSLLPGGQVVTFSPEREFAYASQVQIEVFYDGEPIRQARFATRSLPTFVEGILYDQFGQPIPGIQVSLPELQRSTTTDANGSYSFGYGDQPDNTLPDGRYTLLINEGLRDHRFGSLTKKCFINQGERTSLSPITLPALNKEDNFSPISGGESIRLAKGDLVLDLKEADVFFSNGKTTDFGMALFMPLGTYAHQADAQFMPLWLFNVQPVGIEVSGNWQMNFQLPLHTEYQSHIWPEDTYLILVGYNPDSDRIEPMGVGQVKDNRVHSLKHAFKQLDYIGYAPTPVAATKWIEDYLSGSLSLNNLVINIRELLSTPAEPVAQVGSQ